MVDTNIVHKVEPATVLKIYNTLRLLGFNTRLAGTTLINKVLQILISTNDEFFKLNDVYDIIVLSSNGKFTNKIIREHIRYAINSRDNTKKNFKNVFGYDYDEYIFSNKYFIMEMLRLFIKGEKNKEIIFPY